MKILHTADIHLREFEDERWQALGEVLDLGKQNEADLLVISGDLFDSNALAHELRPKIRDLFAQAGYPVIIISGNHDPEAYPDGAFMGENVTVIRDLLSPVTIEDCVIWGFPYEDLHEEEILEYLHLASDMADSEMTNILLFHGELLDIIDGWRLNGDEGRNRYLPVKLAYFETLAWQYILAGHFHTSFDVHEFREDSFFVYPGSPVSITRRELGQRKVNFFEVGKPPAPLNLSTHFYEKEDIYLDPFSNQSPLPFIEQSLARLSDNATLLLNVFGYFNGQTLEMTEAELHEAIADIGGSRVELLNMEFRDIRDIIEDDLFKQFLRKLEQKELENSFTDDILKMTLQAMMESSK